MGSSEVPSDLLRAIAERRGLVAFVVGAGCSLESPTDLLLSAAYSQNAFDLLKRNGVLEDGDCDPADLSEVASAVFAKEHSQRSLVQALPRESYQHARPNVGHLLAVALMAEGAISCVATVNFDMALSNAITQLQVTSIATVSGPEDLGRFADRTIVYLHRNAYERDEENWILRKEAIEEHWRDGWEAVVAERISSSPQLVFAGLGSKAAALSESLRRVRERVPDRTRTFLADPAETSVFAEDIALADESDHVQLRWGEFMTKLAERVTAELAADLASGCDEFSRLHALDGELSSAVPVQEALAQLGLCELGLTRGQWLGTGRGGYAPDDPAIRSYVPDDASGREHMADLVLGLGALVRSDGCTVEVTSSGTVAIDPPATAGGRPLRVHPASGRGVTPWGAIDKIEQQCRTPGPQSADLVLVAAFRGKRPENPVPPDDILGPVPADDITYAATSVRVVDVDEIRLDPGLREELAR